MNLLTQWTQQSSGGHYSSEEKQALKNTFAELNKLTVELKKDESALLGYIKAHISTSVPFQLRALRRAFEDGRQETLAAKAEMKQPTISNLERPGWNSVNTETLAKLAAAMRVGLIVRFAPISEMIQWQSSFSPDDFSVPTLATETAIAVQQIIIESESDTEREPILKSAMDIASEKPKKRDLLSSIEDRPPFFEQGVDPYRRQGVLQ